MAFTTEDCIHGVREARKYFLKHLKGLREDQWDWKPYPECKSIRETVAHLISDDRAVMQSLETGREPDYDSLQESERDIVRLLALLEESHEQVCAFLKERYADKSLDTEACLYGGMMKLGSAVAHITSEDFYHAGQVAYIRMATEPTWNYYGSIYGGE
jgi:uncharacterized damage-inducible protein DinB